MKTITDSKIIKINNPTGQVMLTTTVGNGNKGGGNVKNEKNEKIVKGLLNNFVLGLGSDLQGKKYVVTTNVLDINPFRDDTPIKHVFSGGALAAISTNEYTGDADEDGVVAFIIEYSFT